MIYENLKVIDFYMDKIYYNDFGIFLSLLKVDVICIKSLFKRFWIEISKSFLMI